MTLPMPSSTYHTHTYHTHTHTPNHIGNELESSCIHKLSSCLSVLVGNGLKECYFDDNDELVGNPIDNEDEEDEDNDDNSDRNSPYMNRIHTLCSGIFPNIPNTSNTPNSTVSTPIQLKICSFISCRLSSYSICTITKYITKLQQLRATSNNTDNTNNTNNNVSNTITLKCNSNCLSESCLELLGNISSNSSDIKFGGKFV